MYSHCEHTISIVVFDKSKGCKAVLVIGKEKKSLHSCDSLKILYTSVLVLGVGQLTR